MECEERHIRLAGKLNELPEIDAANIEFMIRVDQLPLEYQALFGEHVAMDPEGRRSLTLAQFCTEEVICVRPIFL